MQDEQLNKIREKLYDVQVPVDGEIWSSVEGSLRRRALRRAFIYASSVAAILIIALTLFISNPQESHTLQPVAEVTPQNLNETTIDVQQSVEVEISSPVADNSVMDSGRQVVLKGDETAASEGVIETPAVVEQTPAQAPPAEETPNYTLFNLNNYEEYVAEVRSEKRVHSIAVMTNVMPGSSAAISDGIMMASGAGASGISQSATIEQVSDTKYSLPLNLGVQMQFGLSESVAIGVGLNYTMLRSKYDCLINKKMYSVKQTLHYIGIPVNVYGLVVDKNNFSFYVNAGALAEKGLRAFYTLESYNDKVNEDNSISGVLFSVNAGLGVEYKFTNTLGLYFEPNLVYYFNSDVPRSIRTDQPLQVKAELGCRIHF